MANSTIKFDSEMTPVQALNLLDNFLISVNSLGGAAGKVSAGKLRDFIGLTSSSGLVQPVNPGGTLPNPSTNAWTILGEGSYNNGNLVVSKGNIGLAYYNGSTWQVTEMKLPPSDVEVVSNIGVDLSIDDELRNSIAHFRSGHIFTKNFNSSQTKTDLDNFVENLGFKNSLGVDLSFTDNNNNTIAQFRNGHIVTKNFNSAEIDAKSKSSIKILLLSNSFGEDTTLYAPFLLEEMGANDVEIGILYLGGATLKDHYDNLANSPYVFDHYKTSNVVWSFTPNKSYEDGLKFTDWDMIVFNQQSAASIDYSTYQPYLNNLIDYTFSILNKCVDLAFNIIPASPAAGQWGSNLNSNEFFDAQQLCYEQVKNDTAIQRFLYSGTAIQNARQTSLSQIGNNLTSVDNLHLNGGLPRLIAAYGNVMSLKDCFNLKKSVFGSTIRPTEQWLSSKNINNMYGSIGVTEQNVLLAQKCALMAYKFPFQISNINF